MTVRENMGFSLTLRKAPKAEIASRVNAAAEILGLGSLLDRYPRQLSGGQRQRVAMGRAIVRDPKVFLFDEPLSNLDAKLRVQMRVEIKALHQRLATTTIYVTHDQIEAMTMADKIVVMKDGVVEQVGAPIDLYDEPANVFVAQFIGSPAMNILPGRTADGGVLHGDVMLPAPAALVQRAGTGRDVQYGIRPEHLELAGDGIPLLVDVVEPTGSDTVIFGTLGTSAVVVNIRDRADVRAGEKIHVRPQLDKVHLFDAASTKRI
jgi:multiple sugar transport system ATP-binding protein